MGSDIIFIYILIAAIICCFLPKEKQKIASILLLFAMMIICGIRAYDVGVDTHNYVQYVRSSNESDYKWGPLYLLFKQIALLFNNERTAFLMIMSALTYVPLMFIASKRSSYPALSVLFFIIPVADYFVQSMNIVRQSMAIVYVLGAAILIDQHKKKLAALFLVLAFFLHPYTFIAVGLLFLDKIHLTKKGVTIILVVSCLLGLVGMLTGIRDVLNLMMLLTSDSSEGLISKLGKYGGNYDIESNFSLIGQLSHMLPLMAMCWLGANDKSMKSIYFKMMLIGCVITNIFVSVIYCERIASTYTIAQFLAVPMIYKTSSPLYKRLITLLIITTSLLFIYNLKGNMQLDIWEPYRTFMED